MSYPKHFVSYTVMDQEAGANLFHHAFLTFSKQEDENDHIRVENAYGFYSQPSESNWFWKTIGITFKLQNSHGILKQEKFRDINRSGFTAKPIEASPEVYSDMLNKLQNQIEQEQAAIKKYTNEYGENIQPEDIYKLENEAARKEQRSPHLQRFEFRVGYDFSKGMHTTDSYTCKTQALDILEEFNLLSRAKPRAKSFADLPSYKNKETQPIPGQKLRSKSENDSEENRCEIDSDDFGFAFPNTSDEPLEPLFLFSTGKLEGYKSKNSNKTYFNRDWQTGALIHALQPNLQHPLLPQIRHELLALQRLDKQLRQPESDLETNEMNQAQSPLAALFQRFATISHQTSQQVVNSLCKDSQSFRQTYQIKLMEQNADQMAQPEVSAGFVFLSWETLLSATLALSALTLVLALSFMTAGIPLTITVVTSSVAGLVSSIGLFGCSSNSTNKPPSTSTATDDVTPTEQTIYQSKHFEELSAEGLAL